MGSTLYAILEQALISGQTPRLTALITFLAYAITALLSLTVAVSRLISVRRSLASIPKTYIPIGRDDLPEPVWRLLAGEYTRASIISYGAQVRQEGVGGVVGSEAGRKSGWSRPCECVDGCTFLTGVLLMHNGPLQRRTSHRSITDLGFSLPSRHSVDSLPTYPQL